MLSAYILINCTLGPEQNIIKGLAALPEVKEVREIYGIHDIYTKVKTEDIESLNKLVTNKIRRTPTITSTTTMVVIEDQGGKEEE